MSDYTITIHINDDDGSTVEAVYKIVENTIFYHWNQEKVELGEIENVTKTKELIDLTLRARHGDPKAAQRVLELLSNE